MHARKKGRVALPGRQMPANLAHKNPKKLLELKRLLKQTTMKFAALSAALSVLASAPLESGAEVTELRGNSVRLQVLSFVDSLLSLSFDLQTIVSLRATF